MKQFHQNYNILDDPIFQQFTIERNLKPESRRTYKKSLFRYCEYNQMTLTELYNEADQEEEAGVRAKNRTLVQRLRNFRTHLIQKNYAPITTTHYYAAAKSFYTHFLIEVPKIPVVRLPEKQVLIDEIPKKEHIIEMIQHTNNLKHCAIIYFMAASGTARNEIASLTIQDFIDATASYHNGGQLFDIIKTLEKQDNIIPIFKLTRIKTSYIYFTAITPEATQHLIRYLKTRPTKRLRPTQSLFDIKPNSITIFFERLSKKCGYPPNFLHPHSLRKYHSDVLQDWDLTNRLQGRKPKYIQETYSKANPEKLKQRYQRHIDDLTLHPTHMITIESKEVKDLKKQLKEKDEMFRKLESQVHDMQKEQDKWEQMFQQFNEKYKN